MTKFYWKFTTIGEWNPDSVSLTDNPNTPIGLILNENNETQALLSTEIKEDGNIKYIFAKNNELKEFDNLREAVKYIGLDTKVEDNFNFFRKLREFSLKESYSKLYSLNKINGFDWNPLNQLELERKIYNTREEFFK